MLIVSIVIATYNRCSDLKACLECCLKQETDGNFSFHVIVADNNSSDQTPAVVRSFEEGFPGKVRYVFEPRQGKCHALNAAIKESKADIIAFTDDDVRVDGKWLMQLVNCFELQTCDGIGGRVLPLYPPQTPVWVKENIHQLAGAIVIYDYGTQIQAYRKPAYEFLGANFAFRAQVFQDCGLFRTDLGPGKGTFGDDTEFVNRVFNSGKKLFYCGEALVWHPVEVQRMTLKHIAQWNMGIGRYRVIVDEQGMLDPALQYWWGVPRYLIGQIFRNAISLGIFVFNKKMFLKEWIQLFINLGKALQIRKIYLSSGVRLNVI